jgi:myo-inositol-1(or 4)-monophosphatase
LPDGKISTAASPEDEADLELLRSAALEAAELTLRFFRNDPRAWTKAGNSPVSEADMAVDALLKTKLLAARPDYGWLSEETEDDLARLERRRAFVVDPIDGTREFLAGRPGWGVSLAVVEAGRSRAGVFAAPALREVYAAARDGGAYRNGERLVLASRSSLRGIRLAGARGALRGLAEEAGVSASAIEQVGSLSYRVASIAGGRFDLAFAHAGAQDWDLAAADLLVHEAGGLVISLEGEPLRYNQGTPVQPPMVATLPGIAAAARAAIGETLRSRSMLQPSRNPLKGGS